MDMENDLKGNVVTACSLLQLSHRYGSCTSRMGDVIADMQDIHQSSFTD